MAIVFSRKSLNRPTPASFEFWGKIYIGVVGLILAWMPTNDIVPHHVQDVITPLANLFNSIIIFLLPFFGIKTDQEQIPVQDVKVAEDTTNKT